MFEVYKYIDKVKGLNYVLEIAKTRKISLNKLCEGIYDSSNFYKMCKNPIEKNINSEKLRILFAKLNIGKDEIMSNCTIFDKRTLELIDMINNESRSYDFHNLPKYLNELEEISDDSIDEIKQFILWKKGIYEFANHEYVLAMSYLDQAFRVTKKEYKLKLDKRKRLTEMEMNIFNDLLMTKFCLVRNEEIIKYFDVLLEYKPVNKNVIGYIQINRIAALIATNKINNASIGIFNAKKRAKEYNQIGVMALLNYFDGLIYNLIHNDDSKIKNAIIVLEAHGVSLEGFKNLYSI